MVDLRPRARHGVLEQPNTAAASSPASRRAAMVSAMHAHPIAMPASADVEGSSLVMSNTEYALLVRELETLRSAHHSELAQRLHDVRTHGTTSDNDDRHALLEETAVDRARMRHPWGQSCRSAQAAPDGASSWEWEA
jgi:hypothetical protein